MYNNEVYANTITAGDKKFNIIIYIAIGGLNVFLLYPILAQRSAAHGNTYLDVFIR